jgi:acyl carrier protein
MVFEKVKKIIAEQLDVEIEVITLETSLMKDLEADSLDAVEIMMALEDEFSVEIPDEAAEGFKNIGDIVKYVEAKLA